jgi:PAT family acetyl-CoA transporter-like MFS transporter 1
MSADEKRNISRLKSSSILIFLYSLQGLIIGLLLDTMQIQLKLNFTYSEVGIFLLCSYPFSLKIIWSPIVDTYSIKKLGLRKTWIILTQSISIFIILFISYHIDEILLNKRIYFLSIISFLLMFCIATQDIAVDGWALTLCGKEVKIYKLYYFLIRTVH